MNEIMFLLRRKISSKSPQTVELTMLLIGSFVNNCGSRFHAALNDEKFTREIANAVRYYSKRPGIENKQVTDTSLDLIQSWGEAFLPRRKQFYHIVDLYFTLRKENLPFKAQQFDPTRVPIFDSAGGSTHSGASEDTDAILAAAMQSSMQREEEENQRLRRPDPNPSHVPYSDDRRYESSAVRSDIGYYECIEDHSAVCNSVQQRRGSRAEPSVQANPAEEVQSLKSCMAILKDLILATTHQQDFRHDEVAQEVVVQLQSYQSKMTGLIEAALMSDPEVCILRSLFYVIVCIIVSCFSQLRRMWSNSSP
jgi:hypothetical protein